MDTTSNLSVAKVKVEYHDPSGIFPLISDQLNSRLPLHNLNWKSPKRPLRSIESLHVDVVPSPLTAGSAALDQARLSAGHPQATSAPAKERRHQIPGLRQTPYLKLYLLRCDDADSYKSTYRKAVRDWLKSHTPASQSSSKKTNPQENHDAFEWMILHVVLSDTRAASESASPGPGGRPDSFSSDKGKLLNKGASTVFEKLRADFNGSNKTTTDRVAQLKLGAFGSHSTQAQREEWDDIISKLKALILASFDLRVRQYEDDIQEKESQRALPGWNFCTFFVLKEGLARGFESVGLIDDALAGYEELSAELESILSSNEDGGPTASLLPVTEDLKKLYIGMKNREIANDQNFWGQDNLAISSTRKNFRELILANNISVFDFRCYVLARKMAVLLRMSRATKAGPEDLIPLGQLCQLAAWSISNISRVMRQDLKVIARDDPSDNDNTIIENIVASWVYTATQQVLGDTSSAFLAVSTPNEPHFSTLLKENQSAYPTRKSSLSSATHKRQKDDAQALFEQLKGRSASLQPGAQNRSGKDYLAMQRAVLVLLQRRLVENIAGRVQFAIGWAKGDQPEEFAAMREVSLDTEDAEEEERSEPSSAEDNSDSIIGICNYLLYEASTSKKALRLAYESLTREALDLYYAAGQSKSFERMLADLAMVKYQSGDYAGSANYFSKIIPVFSQCQWALIETEMLLVHAKCLKVLNRRDDYVRMLLGLLALVVSSKTAKDTIKTYQHLDIESYKMQGQTLVSELAIVAAQLPYDITVPLSSYFHGVKLDHYIQHHVTGEGFSLNLIIQSVFEDDIIIKNAKVVLTPTSSSIASDIHLESSEDIKISKGLSTIVLKTYASTFGCYDFKQAILQFGRIQFVFSPLDEDLSSPTFGTRPKSPRVLVYPRDDALSATISLCRTIHIERPRRLEIELRNGPDYIKEAEIRLRPASSGLRLHVIDAEIISGTASFKANESSVISLLDIPSAGKVVLSIPYELDDAHAEIVIGMEMSSTQPKLDYRSLQSIIVELPLDVNVHDLFKSDHIFQRFHIKSSNDVPLQILGLDFQDTKAFKVTAPPGELFPTTVFAKHPATYMYEVKQTNFDSEAKLKRQPSSQESPLVLTVQYQCFDELASQTILQQFAKALEQTHFKPLQSLLVHTLKARLRRILVSSSYTESALLGQVQCPDFQETGWVSLLRDLPPSISEDLKTFLESWHAQNQQLPILYAIESDKQLTQRESSAFRTVVISVPLPYLDVLQIANLKVPKLDKENAAVGTAICAKLTLRHTQRWGAESGSEAKNTQPPLEFMYDVDAPSDTWLIGGQRRGRFTAEEDELKSWDIILIPLKTGKILLPFVDVRVVGKNAESITCETEFKGAGQTLTVIGNLKRTTVSVTGNEAQLISAES